MERLVFVPHFNLTFGVFVKVNKIFLRHVSFPYALQSVFSMYIIQCFCWQEFFVLVVGEVWKITLLEHEERERER